MKKCVCNNYEEIKSELIRISHDFKYIDENNNQLNGEEYSVNRNVS